MKVSDLYADNPLRGNDVYLIGTGPSLNLIPPAFFRDRCCVLLNQAQLKLRGVGPVAFANNVRKQLRNCELPIQVVKGRLKDDPQPERTDNHVPWNSPKYHVFSYREPPWDQVSHHDESRLWAEPDFYWAPRRGSVSAFAIQFAVLCGAKTITLAGCDCCEFDGEQYAMGLERRATVIRHYEQYAAGILVLRRECLRLGVPLLTLSPFAGFGREAAQYPLLKALHQEPTCPT